MGMKHFLRATQTYLPVVSICSLFAATALGATPEPSVRELSLSECIEMALEHNLDIRIQQQSPKMDRFTLEGSYAAWDPSFTSTLTHNFNSSPGGTDSDGRALPSTDINTENVAPGLTGTLPTGLRYDLTSNFGFRDINNARSEYSSSANISVRQPLLKNMWIDDARRQILLNRKTLRSSELGVSQQAMTTISAVEQAYYDLIFAEENVKVQKSALELAQRLLDENKKRVEVGALAPLDEKQAESQVAARQADLITANRQLADQQNSLKKLIMDDFSAWRPVYIKPKDKLLPIAQTFDVQESWRNGIEERPDLAQSRIDLEKQAIQLRYTRNQLYPSLDLFGSFGQNGLGPNMGNVIRDIEVGENPKHSYGIVLTIPLGNRAARNAHNSAKALKEQLLLRYKKLEQDTIVNIDNSVRLAQANYEQIDATRKAREYAEAALDAEQKKLANGKSTSFVVLQLQRDLTSARSSEIRALADYNKALSQLSLNEGSTLKRNKLEVKLAP
jgi:outer membrane protein